MERSSATIILLLCWVVRCAVRRLHRVSARMPSSAGEKGLREAPELCTKEMQAEVEQREVLCVLRQHQRQVRLAVAARAQAMSAGSRCPGGSGSGGGVPVG